MVEHQEKFDEKSCGIVLFREDNDGREYLLLHYPGGHWDFPKGHVEGNEEEEETAHRELLEETGIADIEFIKGFRKMISYTYKRKEGFSNKQVIFFLGKTNLKDIRLSHEHRDSIWLPYSAAKNKVTFDNARNLLDKAERLLG